MKTIAIVSQKGGSGKTTTSINLGVAHSVTNPTVILDIDPQASAAKWKDRRSSDSPVIEAVPGSRLQKTLEAAAEGGADWAIIDTAPHSERDALGAARLADLILTPCRPGILDLDALLSTMELIAIAKKPAVAVLTGCPASGSLAVEARGVIEELGMEVCPVRIGYRAAFIHSLTAGLGVGEFEPEGKASHEISRLHKWLVRKLT